MSLLSWMEEEEEVVVDTAGPSDSNRRASGVPLAPEPSQLATALGDERA